MKHLLCSSLLIAHLGFISACGDADVASPVDDTSQPGDGADSSSPDSSGPDNSDTSGNRPPELARIGDRLIARGDTLAIQLSALDPDADPLSYAFYGDLPGTLHFDREQGSFAWTPDTLGTYSLTFVVSDGVLSDRQTIQVEVSAQVQPQRPRFLPQGDLYLAPGEALDLTLRAHDPNGDALRYRLLEAPEERMQLNAETGHLQWQPSQAPVCQPLPVRISVSDGQAEDELAFSVVIGNGSSTCPAPPTLTPIPAQDVAAGQRLELTLQANDLNGDPLSFTLVGDSSAGAEIVGSTFSWMAPLASAGQTQQFWISVSDGLLRTILPFKVMVRPPAWSCSPDRFEPNDTIDQASPITAGTLEGTLCEALEEDLYRVTVGQGQTLSASLSFDPALADLDFALFSPSGTLLALSEDVSSPERLRWTSDEATELLLFVYAYTLDSALPYTVELSVQDALTCTDDAFEPNNSITQAHPLEEELEGETLHICAGDSDVWSLQLACGEQLEVLLDIKGEADLDLYLYGPGDHIPRDGAATEAPLETLSYGPIATPGQWYLEVQGYPMESAQSPYELIVDRSNRCVDPVGPHASLATARVLQVGGDATGILCCEEDWFRIEQGAQTSLTLNLLGDGEHSLELVVLDGATQRQVAWLWDSPEGGTLELHPSGNARTLYVVLSGTVKASYLLELH